MRLRHVEIFSAIMQTGSTSGAATLLHVSQPAISKMLQHAEQSLGFPLFKRSRGKLVATPEAHALYQQTLPFNDHLNNIRRLVDTLRKGSAAPLRVAATPTLAHHLLPAALAKWTRLYPDSECEIAVSHTRETVHSLLLNESDLGLTMQPVSHPNIVCRPVRRGGICAIAPMGWWPKNKLNKALHASDFAAQPMIAIDVRDHLGAVISTWLGGLQPSPRVTATVQTYTLARSLVEAGIGIAIVDWFTANFSNGADTIQVRKLNIENELDVYALTTETHPPPKTAEYLIGLLAN
jgi:DNA-binding transcriptional LysR family regulator